MQYTLYSDYLGSPSQAHMCTVEPLYSGCQLAVLYGEVSLIQTWICHSSMWLGLQTVSSLEGAHCTEF